MTTKASEEKIKSLESTVKLLIRRLAFLEKENARRKRDVEELKRNVK